MVRISIHSFHLHSVYQWMNSSRKTRMDVRSVFLGLMLL